MATSKRLTIACIAANLHPNQLGGAEHHVVEVIKLLARKHHIYLFVGTNTTIKSIFPRSVKVIPVNYPRIPGFMGLCYLLWGYPQIKRFLSQHPFDLLWAKQSYPQAPVAALLKRALSRPLYVTAQNPHLHLEELVLTNPVLSPFARLFATTLTPLIAWSFRQADLVAAVSQYSRQLAINMGATTTIVPNGVNLPCNIRTTRPSTPLQLFSASALIPRNGIDILIKAVSLLPSNFDYHLTIAGDGPAMTQLQKLVSNLNIKSRVTLLGKIPNSQIPQLLRQSHVFIRPSRWEGFGVAFIEAMAYRTPVIATAVGGIPDFITHQRTGLLAKVANPQSVADNIILLHQNPQLKRSIINRAHQLVKQSYTWDDISQQIETHFQTLCHT